MPARVRPVAVAAAVGTPVGTAAGTPAAPAGTAAPVGKAVPVDKAAPVDKPAEPADRPVADRQVVEPAVAPVAGTAPAVDTEVAVVPGRAAPGTAADTALVLTRVRSALTQFRVRTVFSNS